MVFPDRQDGVLEGSQPKYASRDQLFYPYTHDGKPIAISPSDYGLNYKPSRMEKIKIRVRPMWLQFWRWCRKQSVWLNELGSTYQDGFYRSTIPSADVLANPRHEPIRKLLWCAVLAPLIYFTIADLTEVIQGYMEYPVIYTYEYKTNDTLEFPDVTICNVNPFLKSKACANDSLLYKPLLPNNTDEPIRLEPFCANINSMWMCNRLCGEDEVVQQPNENDTKIREALAQWIKETVAFGDAGEAAINELGHRVKNIVKKCSYASNDDCTTRIDDRFTETMSQLYGSCFCFHCGKKNNSSLTDKNQSSPNARTAPEAEKKSQEKYYEYGTLSSPLSGLVIQLATEIQEYLPTSNEVGFVAMIHEHNKDYQICQDAVYILPGYTTYIGLNLATTYNLEPPYEDGCRDEWPKALKDGKFEAAVQVIDIAVETQQYSRSMCLEYCEIEYIIFKCKCIKNDPSVKIHPDLTENYKYCKSNKKERCTTEEVGEKTNKYWEARCDCRRECKTQRYAMDVSVAGFVADENDTANRSDEDHVYAEMSNARLVVYFHSFTYEHVKAIKKYDEIRVLSNIGGINGMYLGLSFYLLFQALDIIVMGAVQFVRKVRSTNFSFGQDGNLMSSVAIQTSARVDRGRRDRARPAVIHPAPEPVPEVPYDVSQRKNIWDVFEKPSGNNSFNTTQQFNTSYGAFAIQYYKR